MTEKFTAWSPYEEGEPLTKGFGKMPGGLPVIAIGPQGGQIVGYDKKLKPIYATSAEAKKLDKEYAEKKAKGLAPKTTKLTSAAIAAAAAPDPFPEDLNKLEEIPAGIFAGSHGNKLFKDPETGKRYLFKKDKLNISLAEEAASRIGALLVPGQVHSAKVVKLGSQTGAIIAINDDYEPIGKESSSHEVSPALLKKFQEHFDSIVQQHVLDWAISQHDSHGANVGIADGQVYGIDKGQAWKFLGSDALPKKGAEFSKAANPNPSVQVYSQFWKAFHDGKLTGDPVKAASVVLSRIKAVSDDQFKAILTPYAELMSKKHGGKPADFLSKLLKRLKESHSNWEWFLGKPIPLTAEAASGAPSDSGTTGAFEDPGKPEPEPETTTPQKQTGFIPVSNKSGSATILHPGGDKKPFPGYPGLGFKAKVKYKGKEHTMEFLPSGKVKMTFPEGKEVIFNSPNEASDAVYLNAKGLPLDMSATEKKAKSIAYPAKSFLKLKEFKDALEGYVEAPPPPPPKEEPPSFAKQLLDHGNGLIQNFELVPGFIQDWAKATEGSQGGQVYAHDNMWVVPFVNTDGKAVLKVWKASPDGAIQDTGDPLDAEDAQQQGLYSSVPVPKVPKKAPGMAPSATPTGSSKVQTPPDAPAVSHSPLPVGTIVTTSKEFKGLPGEQNVQIQVLDKGYAVKLPGEDNWETFKTISAASDYVWLIQKGYTDKKDYTAKTGKKKVSSGGGWKFWGLTPSELKTVSATAATAPEPAPTPSENNFETMPEYTSVEEGKFQGVAPPKPTADPAWSEVVLSGQKEVGQTTWLISLKPGTKLSVAVKPPYPNAIDATKTTSGEWEIDPPLPDDVIAGDPTELSNISLLQAIHKMASKDVNGNIPLIAKQAPSGPVTESTPAFPDLTVGAEPTEADKALASAAWDTMQTGQPSAALVPLILHKEALSAFVDLLPLGTVIEVTTENDVLTVLKTQGNDGEPELYIKKKGYEFVHAADIVDALSSTPLVSTKLLSEKEPHGSKPDAPPASEAVQKMPQAMSVEEGQQLVKTTLPFEEAFEHMEFVKANPMLKLQESSTQPGKLIVTVDASWGPDFGKVLITQLAGKHTVAFEGPPQTNALGTFAVVDQWTVNKGYEVKAPAKKVNPVVAKNNFETMPEVIGKSGKKIKTIGAGTSLNGKLQKLMDLPVSTQLHFGDGTSVSKWQDGSEVYYLDDQTKEKLIDYEVTQLISTKSGCSVTPNGHKPPAKPLPKAPEPVSVPIPPKPTASPDLEAKKEWAKVWKSLSSDLKTHIDALAKKAGLEGAELIVRQSDNMLIIGDGSQAMVDAFAKFGASGQDTPFGPMAVITTTKLKSETPEATTIKGPDGANYPFGTTFEEEKVFQTVEQGLENQPGKLSPYLGPEGDKYEKTYKIPKDAGSEETAKNIQKMMGIDTPIKVGSHYVLFPIPTGTLAKETDKFDLKVTAKQPKQPEPTQLKGLGISSGPSSYGQPAPINRDDLGNLDSITIGRFGHKVAIGRGHVFMDGGVRVFKVKKPDGKVYYRVLAEMTRPSKDDGTFTEGKMDFPKGTKKHSILSDWGGGENDYDPATGVHTLQAESLYSRGNTKTLANGARAAVFSGVATWDRHIMLEVPEGASVEQALADAMATQGYDPNDVLAEPDDVDRRILMKQQIIVSCIGPLGRRKVAGLHSHGFTREKWEAQLDDLMSSTPGSKTAFEKASVITGGNGMHTVVSSDLDAKLGIDKPMKGLVTGISTNGMVNLLIQQGYGGQHHRMMTGNSAPIHTTASGSTDMGCGGGFGSFCRLISDKNDSAGGVGGGAPKVVIHPRVLRGTNWYANNADGYGAQASHLCPGTWAPRTRGTAGNMTSPSNEVMVEDIDITNIAGFIVPSEQAKQKMVDNAKKAGIEELNGVPLADCIAVGSTSYNLSSTMAKLPLMKEPL